MEHAYRRYQVITGLRESFGIALPKGPGRAQSWMPPPGFVEHAIGKVATLHPPVAILFRQQGQEITCTASEVEQANFIIIARNNGFPPQIPEQQFNFCTKEYVGGFPQRRFNGVLHSGLIIRRVVVELGIHWEGIRGSLARGKTGCTKRQFKMSCLEVSRVHVPARGPLFGVSEMRGFDLIYQCRHWRR